MPIRLPANYRKLTTFAPEITPFFGAITYWLFFCGFAIVFFMIPIMVTEGELLKDDPSSTAITDETRIFLGILLCLALLWLVKKEIRRWTMRIFGAKQFGSGRILSDKRFLGKKKYIPRILDNYWAENWYFLKSEYVISLFAPFFIILLSLLLSLVFIQRTDLRFLYILFLFLFHGFYSAHDVWLLFFVLFLPSDSYIHETSSGLDVYSLTVNKV